MARGATHAEHPRWVHIDAVNTDREMHAVVTAVAACRTNHRRAPHALPRRDRSPTEKRVAGAYPASVVDGDRRVVDDPPRVGDDADTRRTHRRSDGDGKVDTPMAGVAPGRRKACDDRPAHGWNEAGAARGEDDHENVAHQQPPAESRLAAAEETLRGGGRQFQGVDQAICGDRSDVARDSAVDRNSLGRKGLVRKASAPSRSAFSRVSSCAWAVKTSTVT